MLWLILMLSPIISDLADQRAQEILDWSDIDAQCPLTDHPLNDGLELWMPVIPGKDGGNSLWDIRKWREGTLTNGPTWSGDKLRFDGSDDFVACSIPIAGNFDGSFTIAAMATYDVLSGLRATVASGSGYWAFLGTLDSAPYFALYDGTNNPAATSGSLTAGVEYHLVAVRNTAADTLEIYLDGRSLTSTSDTTTTTPTSSVFNIGAQAAGFRLANGAIRSVHAWRRALSSSEVYASYQEARTDYPQTLNRVPSYSVFDVGAAPSGGPFPWHLDDLAGGFQTIGLGTI